MCVPVCVCLFVAGAGSVLEDDVVDSTVALPVPDGFEDEGGVRTGPSVAPDASEAVVETDEREVTVTKKRKRKAVQVLLLTVACVEACPSLIP